MEIICHYEDSAFYKEYEEAGWEVTEADKETSSLMIRNDGTAEAKEQIRQVLESGKRSWFLISTIWPPVREALRSRYI